LITAVYDAAVVQAFKDYGIIYIKQQLIWMGLGVITLVNLHSF